MVLLVNFFKYNPIKLSEQNMNFHMVICNHGISMSNVVEGSMVTAKKIYMCVYCHMSKKSRVGRSALILFFFKLTAKPEIVVPGSGIRYFIFEIFGKPSFVLWRVTWFFYLLCSQFRQKASGWINKTLLLIKQQKWLSEFRVKIDRVVSKN